MGMPDIKSSDTKRNQAVTDAIQSVALEEAAIAHILNAEGEKLQKAIHCEETDVCMLLEVNRSVESMVKNLIELEKTLINKLETLKDFSESKHPCDNQG